MWIEDTSAMILRCGDREGYQKIHLGVSTWQEDPYEMLAGLAECRIAAGSQKQEGVRFYDTGKKKQKPKKKNNQKNNEQKDNLQDQSSHQQALIQLLKRRKEHYQQKQNTNMEKA